MRKRRTSTAPDAVDAPDSMLHAVPDVQRMFRAADVPSDTRSGQHARDKDTNK